MGVFGRGQRFDRNSSSDPIVRLEVKKLISVLILLLTLPLPRDNLLFNVLNIQLLNKMRNNTFVAKAFFYYDPKHCHSPSYTYIIGNINLPAENTVNVLPFS